MDKFLFFIAIMIITAIAVSLVYFGLTPQGREIWKQYQQKKTDDRITDEQRKEVEDTCRKMIASWEADLYLYKQTKNIEAKERANRTAAEYNKYILQNGYVFGETLPDGVFAVIDSIE